MYLYIHIYNPERRAHEPESPPLFHTQDHIRTPTKKLCTNIQTYKLPSSIPPSPFFASAHGQSQSQTHTVSHATNLDVYLKEGSLENFRHKPHRYRLGVIGVCILSDTYT